MRLVLVGGAGEVGSEIARDLALGKEIDELLIADLDRGRATALADELGEMHRTSAPASSMSKTRSPPEGDSRTPTF